MASITQNRPSFSVQQVVSAGAIAAVVAAIANLIVYFLADPIAKISTDFPVANPISVIMSCVFGTIGATIVLMLLNRFTQNPLRNFQIVSVVALLLSLGGPLNAGSMPMPGMPAPTSSVIVVLVIMHVVAAAAIVGTLTFRLQKTQ